MTKTRGWVAAWIATVQHYAMRSLQVTVPSPSLSLTPHKTVSFFTLIYLTSRQPRFLPAATLLAAQRHHGYPKSRHICTAGGRAPISDGGR